MDCLEIELDMDCLEMELYIVIHYKLGIEHHTYLETCVDLTHICVHDHTGCLGIKLHDGR